MCPNGERISAREKLVLMILADRHQDKTGSFTYPAVDTIAEEAMCDRRSCQRYLASLEAKGVIKRLRPANQGRGMQCFYFFTALDVAPEGWQPAALFFGGRAAEGRQKGGRRAAIQRAPLIERAQERELQLQLETTPPNPLVAEGETAQTNSASVSDAARAMEDALDQVMRNCGFTAKRLRKKLHAVVMQRVELGQEPAAVAAAMAEAWKSYSSQDTMLRVKANASRFFEEGLWLNSRSWHWDNEMIRERRRAAEARAGSYCQ